MDQIIVGMADFRITDVPCHVLATYALGSCIGLVVHDPVARIGGLLHFMLPDSSLNPVRSRENPFVFADTGIPLFLQQLYERGASKRRLRTYVAGGAQMMDRNDVFAIGKRNHLAVRKILWKSGILLHSELVGGSNSRSLKLEVATGKLWLLEHAISAAGQPASTAKERESWRIVS